MDKHWHSNTRQYLKKECEQMNNAHQKTQKSLIAVLLKLEIINVNNKCRINLFMF